MKKLLCITLFLMNVTQFASANQLLQNFSDAEEFLKQSALTVDEFRAISTNLRMFFNKGNVTEFNNLKSKYPTFPIDLREVNCYRRSLKQIDLRNAILTHADFRGCDLEGARFENSYLADSNFRSFAGFGETNISGVNFTGAIFKYHYNIESQTVFFYDYSETEHPAYPEFGEKYAADFRDTDLSNTLGVDTSLVDSRGTKAMALANSNEIFTGTHDDGSFENAEAAGYLQKIRPDDYFISELDTKTKNRLVGKKVWILFGGHFGPKSFDVINTDPNVVLVLKGFSSHGYVKSVSDIIMICSRESREYQISMDNIKTKGIIHYSYLY